MIGISKERLLKIANETHDSDDTNITVLSLLDMLINACEELDPWMPIDEFLKSGFVGKCFIFTENLVLETDFDQNGFWYVFKYVDNNKITHVMPIHKPEPPR